VKPKKVETSRKRGLKRNNEEFESFTHKNGY